MVVKDNINPELLKKLACPICKGNLVYENNIFFCKKCNKEYNVEDNIPIFL